jgi:hypothetical protein
MCFSQSISFTFAIMGAIATFFTYNDKYLRSQYTFILVAFYTLMEALQTIQYSFVNQCTSNVNIFFTNIAYVLVIVQPLLWNTVFYMRASKSEKNIYKLAIILCLVWVTWNVAARFMYDPLKHNKLNQCTVFNSESTCTVQEDKSHLYWKWTSGYFPDFSANYFMYFALWIIPGLLVANDRWSIYMLLSSIIVGGILTYRSTGRFIEFASIWCYVSIPFFIFSFVLSIKNKMK